LPPLWCAARASQASSSVAVTARAARDNSRRPSGGHAVKTDQYRATSCRVCGRRHDLYHTSEDGPGDRAAYAYDCPETGVAVFFRPDRPPDVATAVPKGAVPLRWVAD
jgi:hypothetical protein